MNPGKQQATGAGLRIAMLSLHSHPLGRLGTSKTGGMSVYIMALARQLSELGHRVDIITAVAGMSTDEGQEIFPNVMLYNLYARLSFTLDSPDLCSSEDLQSCVAALLEWGATGVGKYDLIHSNYWFSGLAGEILQREWRCPHVLTFHTLAGLKKAALAHHTEPGWRLAAEESLLQNCDLVAAATRAEKNYLQQRLGNGSKQLRVIGAGVDLDHFLPAAEPVRVTERVAEQPFTILFVGRFDPMKGVTEAVQSVAQLGSKLNFRLQLVGGDGPETESAKMVADMVRAHGLVEKIKQTGIVPFKELPRLYQEADVVLVASHYESFCLVILEALACGTPVVSTRVGVAAEVIVPGVNGYLIEPGDVVGMARAIELVAENLDHTSPGKIRASVGGYGWPAVAMRLLDAYYDTINNYKQQRLKV